MILAFAIIGCILSGLFGWWMGRIAHIAHVVKDVLGHNLKGLEVWKVWVLELIFVLMLFINSFVADYNNRNRVYNTKDYVIETMDTTFDADSTEVTSFKIVKR